MVYSQICDILTIYKKAGDIMNKKLFRSLLSGSLIAVLLLASSCNTQTDDETTALDSNMIDIQERYGSYEPWNYFPGGEQPLSEESALQYDIEIIMEQTVYEEMPERIEFTIKNRAKGPLDNYATFIERYENPFKNYGLEGGAWDIGGWVRVPYYTNPSAGSIAKWENTGVVLPYENLQREYTYEPGSYRLVVFLPDGAHYAYFEVT